MALSWHALFASLPADAVPTRQPVVPPEMMARPEACGGRRRDRRTGAQGQRMRRPVTSL
jgi:hypothetical protein